MLTLVVILSHGLHWAQLKGEEVVVVFVVVVVCKSYELQLVLVKFPIDVENEQQDNESIPVVFKTKKISSWDLHSCDEQQHVVSYIL